MSAPLTGKQGAGLPESLYAQLLRYVARRLGSATDATEAEDLVQQIFLKVLQSSDVPGVDEFRPWLFRVARNAVIDAQRRRPAQLRLHAAYVSSTASDPVSAKSDSSAVVEPGGHALDERQQVDANEIAAYLVRLVHELTEQDQDALSAVDLAGISQKDYAIDRKLAYVTAKSRVQRARKRLRKELEARCELQLDARGMPLSCKPRDKACCT